MRDSFVGIVVIVLVLFAVLWSCTHPVRAHEIYSKTGCCGGNDCRPVDTLRQNLVETDDEWIVEGKWHFRKKDALPSPDGQFHYCIRYGKPGCFFVPQAV